MGEACRNQAIHQDETIGAFQKLDKLLPGKKRGYWQTKYQCVRNVNLFQEVCVDGLNEKDMFICNIGHS